MKKIKILLVVLVVAVLAATFAACDVTGKTITEVLAQGIVLENIGVDFEDVDSLSVVKESENDYDYYAIEVVIDSVTYKYRVETKDGTILNVNVNGETVDSSNVSSNPAASEKGYIGKDGALQIALKDAGTTQSEVTITCQKLDFCHGKYLYEIEFILNGVEYEYDIDAVNGTIVKKEKDHMPVQVTPPEGVTYLSVDEIKAIALADAQVEQTVANFAKIHLDHEHGTVVYEVKFWVESAEYEYEINAVTGAIIKREIELHDDSQQGNNSEYIGSDAAKQIAFAHAGINASDAKKVDVEWKDKHGKALYEVEFESGNYEFEYSIDAVTGQVLSVEKDIAD